MLIPLAACDATFQPLEDEERAFSIYDGYLNPAANIQWIRVMLWRKTVFTSPGPDGVTVSLVELGSGRTLEVRDSVFHHVANETLARQACTFTTTGPPTPSAGVRRTGSPPPALTGRPLPQTFRFRRTTT
ncbi:MAG TPA: hypothetical protein VNZ57_11410 [Longimicrobiales bacterium]|nr:hypothetical protein [Longimicrobiales bacterium]